MALNHLKKGLRMGLESIHLNAKQIEKELRPLIKVGHITAKDAKYFVREVIVIGRRAKAKASKAAKLEAKKLINRMGYVTRQEGDTLKKRIAQLEKKLKAKKR